MRLAMLTLLIGVLLGAFGLRIAENLGFVSSPAPRVLVQTDRPEEGRPRSADTDVEALALELRQRVAAEPAPRDLSTLAVALESAKWDGDWLAVEATALAIRADGSQWMNPSPGTAAAPAAERAEVPEAGLVAEARALERRFALRALAARNSKATALMGRSDPQAIALLIGLLGASGTSSAVRQDAALVLAQAGDLRGLQALIDALRSSESEVRDAAARALAFVDHTDGAVELAALVDAGANEEAMRQAAEGLARFDAVLTGEPHPATDGLLQALASHRLASVRAAAAAGLASTDLSRAPRARAALLEAIARDREVEVRRAAAAAARGFAEALGASEDLLAAAITALGEEQDTAVLEALVPILAQGDADALSALDAFGSTARGRAIRETVTRVAQDLRERLDAGR